MKKTEEIMNSLFGPLYHARFSSGWLTYLTGAVLGTALAAAILFRDTNSSDISDVVNSQPQSAAAERKAEVEGNVAYQRANWEYYHADCNKCGTGVFTAYGEDLASLPVSGTVVYNDRPITYTGLVAAELPRGTVVEREREYFLVVDRASRRSNQDDDTLTIRQFLSGEHEKKHQVREEVNVKIIFPNGQRY